MNLWFLGRIIVLFTIVSSVALGSALATDSFEPNDTPAQAHPLTSGQTIESWISHADDDDWYRFQHTSAGQIQVSLTSLPFDYDMELYLFVPPDSLRSMASSTNPEMADELILHQGVAGEYYLRVYYWDNFHADDSYSLRADFSGGAGNTAPQVNLVSPNGGESYAAGSNQTITYIATDAEQPGSLSIDIELSTNGGANWSALATATSNSGSFPWTVPNSATTQARVRVTANDGQLTGNDTSTGNFAITTVPTGSNTLAVTNGTGTSGSTITVQLTLDNDDTVKAIQADLLFDPAVLRLTRFEASERAAVFLDSSGVVVDGHARVVLFSQSNAVLTPGSGTVAQIDFEAIGSGGTSSAVTPSATVISDQNGQALNVTATAGQITVTGGTTPPLVTVLSPNGGESFQAGSIQNVTWAASGGAGPLTIAIDYSTNGGGSFVPIQSGLSNTGVFTWSVPNTPTTQGRIRVTASDGQTQANDSSTGDFTIAAVPAGNVVSIGSTSGESGTIVSVPLQLNNQAVVKALQLDIAFNSSIATFLDAQVTNRGLSLADSSSTLPNGSARVILFARANQTLPVGNGTVANLSFQLLGTANQTPLTPSNIVLSGPEAELLTATSQSGVLTVTGGGGGGDEPRLNLAVLQNPGRTRNLQIFVSVERGSGNPPVLTVGGSPVPLSPVSTGLFQASFFVAQSSPSVTILATDATSEGTGTDQVTVSF